MRVPSPSSARARRSRATSPSARCRNPCASSRRDRRAPPPCGGTASPPCRSRRGCWRSPPLLPPLPAADTAHAGIADAEIEFLDVFVALQALGAAFEHDAPAFEHIAEIGDVERHLRVLLDE